MRSPGTAYDNPYFGTDPQPDHMNNIYVGPDDYGGVHINSGIPNKAFYLAASELGIDVAARIWYRSLQLLWSTAQFADAAALIAESARVQTKAGLAPAGAAQAVRSAFRAVGL
jgi:Zn-dependent metalloprotease